MSPEWIETTIGDQVTLQRGIDITKTAQRDGLVPVISSGGVSSYHDTAAVAGPGVVLGRKGVVGSVYFVASDYWPHDTTLWVKDFHNNDPRFTYYFFKAMARRIATMDVGSANPTLNRNHVHPIEIRWPTERSEQRAIAQILGTLDDKIELNRRMNDTLEAMARALFRSWFVDFDPVRTKLDNGETSLPPAIAESFPGRFDKSDESLPEGWRRQSIYEIAEVIYGAPFSSKTFNTSGVGRPLLRIRDLADEDPSVFTEEEHPKGYLVKPGDIVVGMDGEFRAYLWGGAESWLNQRICCFKPKRGISSAFVFYSLSGPLAAVEASETATTVIHLGKNDIDRFTIVAPPEGVRGLFNDFVEPIFARIVANKQQSAVLAALRDTLLPRLISGEIRVKDAEKQAEAVA